jgi:hypothetical protein
MEKPHSAVVDADGWPDDTVLLDLGPESGV